MWSSSTSSSSFGNGYLILFLGTEHINVPAIQEVVAGSNITLECSSDLLEATVSSWKELSGDVQVSNPLIHVTLQQQGEYECTIQDGRNGHPVFSTTINLRVVGKNLKVCSVHGEMK